MKRFAAKKEEKTVNASGKVSFLDIPLYTLADICI